VQRAQPGDSAIPAPETLRARVQRDPPLRHVLGASRYVVVIAVVGALASAVVALLYGAVAVVGVVVDTLNTHDVSTAASKHLAIELIQLTDLFLLGVVLYIVALGLYELFIDPELPTPAWLSTRTLDDLKQRLLGVIVVLLSVTFLSDVVDWDGSATVLALGAAVGAVLLPLIILNREHPSGDGGTPPGADTPSAPPGGHS